ncbi:hypothetical protein GTA51_17000 [Desulfovibrio aerotolerans]|uniref:Uncharacterized protein n=1 Tax=Solidesulfovibrio aerotolerans TaxID=295255 RepID=A0A7C9MWX6_9BACT|nr:hypothetical protein [Solidesulfovibrio aerotolerans]MYL84814.1 hypothetical protein [Solidesulfovibrio aerotolerans]
MNKKRGRSVIEDAIAEEFGIEPESEDFQETTVDLVGLFGSARDCLVCKANGASKNNTILPGNVYEFNKGELCKKHFKEIMITPHTKCHFHAKTDSGEDVVITPRRKD